MSFQREIGTSVRRYGLLTKLSMILDADIDQIRKATNRRRNEDLEFLCEEAGKGRIILKQGILQRPRN